MNRLNDYKKKMELYVLEDMKLFWEDESEGDSDRFLAGVDECEKLLTEFLERLDRSEDRSTAFDAVEWLVKKLNDLNEQYDFLLIETDERESLCEYIFGALDEMGIETDEDITEKWREW